MKDRSEHTRLDWDPYEVWRTLILENPDLLLRQANPETFTDPETFKEFAMTIGEFPDDLQDFLFVLAQEYGVEAAHNALDEAVRCFYASQEKRSERKSMSSTSDG